MKVYKVAWAPPVLRELMDSQRPERKERTRRRAEELNGSRIEWQALKLRARAAIAYGRRGQADGQVFSATPLGLEYYALTLLQLRPLLREELQEELQPIIDEVLSIAEDTREVRIALWKLRPEPDVE
jgi:hypothetical protein